MVVNRYGISVLQLTTDMFQLSQTLPGSFLIDDLDITKIIATRLTRRVPLVEQELLYPSGAPEFTPCF
jgi:hypothetical protein